MDHNTQGFDDDPPPEPRDGWLLVRIHVPELNVYKCLQFPADRLVWDVKQQVLASLPKELKESFNYGLFCPPSNGKAGKFLDEERRLGDYPFNGPVGYLELKYKRRVYKMLNLDERQLKALHTRANLRRFLECINGGHVEKIAKMCAKGLDPNFHCPESGETPLTVATGAKKPNKLLIALVNGGALLDYRTKDGATALHKAVEKDSLEAVTTLLELGASPNYKDSRGITPLYISITKKCDPKITESLLHDHATLGIQDNQGWQEVHQACRHGLVHHLEHLLFYGADMDGRNASGNTPLHVCAVNNQEACARMLLFRGAQRGALNFANQSPYQVAVIAGNLELAEVIQNYKSDDIVPFRGPPRYNPRRRSGVGWLTGNGGGVHGGGSLMSTLTRNSSCSGLYGPPSPCPSEHLPYSSASSSLSEGSSGHRSHEDDISIVTDKSLGDTSDIISDSSGVGTNSDSAACSIGHPSTTVVCMEPYAGNSVGHIRIHPGDVIEVVGSTDCGLLEGYVRGSNQSGFFPAECVEEVNIRQKNITNVSTASHQLQQQYLHQGSPPMGHGVGLSNNSSCTLPRNMMMMSHHHSPSLSMGGGGMNAFSMGNNNGGQQYSSATAPRIRKTTMMEPRTVNLHRAKRGFGFILRGAKASSPLMQLKPSDRFPALQYLDDVDPGGVADMAGLRPGDFLLAIGGEDVRAASHEKVVDMIRSAGALVSMTVISPQYPNQMQAAPQYLQGHFSQATGIQQSVRQCATLPRKMSLGPTVAGTTSAMATAAGGSSGSGSISGSSSGGRLPAPMPPRRDPKTTLSVGRARAKSMVAGLENGGEKDDEDIPTKSNSIESISTPTPTHPGTPVQLRTASIKARPTSSRITAAELEELFQRQQGETADSMNRYSTMMTTSRFQSGTDSGAATPPVNNSPFKGPLVYGSVAEMKRKTKTKNGTLRGKPCPIPTIGGSDLKRFHSTPDLNTHLNSSSSSIWNAVGKGHHSQDDVATLHASMQRLNLPPPTHPPPPPPVGQVVKVDVSRCSEYESTLTLQQKLKKRTENECGDGTTTTANGVASSFNPSANAKLYASPQELRNVVAWKLRTAAQENRQNGQQQNSQQQTQLHHQQQQPSAIIPPPPPPMQPLQQQTAAHQLSQPALSQYAQPTRQQIIGLQNYPNQSQNTHSKVQQQPEKSGVNNNNSPSIGSVANPITTTSILPTGPAPPIPEPDYSFSESDGEDENSILVARNTKLNEKIALIDVPETSGNSQTSGSSSGSASISHSFSVDEIQRIRTNLKASKSYPNGLLKQEASNASSKNDSEDGNNNSNQNNSSINGSSNNNEQVHIPKNDTNRSSQSNIADPNEEGDNSSSGVSSDQEIIVGPANKAASGISTAKHHLHHTDTIKKKPTTQSANSVQQQKPAKTENNSVITAGADATSASISTAVVGSMKQTLSTAQAATPKVKTLMVTSQQLGPKLSPALSGRIPHHHHHKSLSSTHAAKPTAANLSNKNNLLSCNSINSSISTSVNNESEQEQRSDEDGDLSPSPPAKAFQRHNSLTRKQAAAIAMTRASRAAVSLVQLPPPIEADSDNEMMIMMSGSNHGGVSGGGRHALNRGACSENIVLAPPPQFCDCNDIKHSSASASAAGSIPGSAGGGSNNRVRIVGAVPKANRLHSQ